MIIFYAHGGSDNHGCEAIIRGTCENLPGKKILYSSNAKADKMYGVDNICEVKPDAYKRYYKPLRWLFIKIYTTIFHTNVLFSLVDGKKHGIYLSVGGDNYCYPRLIEPILKANKRIRSRKNKTILWGTSIEDEALHNSQILDDIKQYDYIFARESITYNSLISCGLANKTFLYPDPAFAMKAEKTAKMKDIFDREVVGINISPLILKYGEDSVITKGYIEIIDYLLGTTNSNILLIPHVVKRNNDDRLAIEKIRKMVHSDRLYVLDDMPAENIKYVISKLSFFMGARTHSTIAAYSTCIPTLVVGYSVKAKGIAQDIFGTDEGYVIDVRELNASTELTDAFKDLYLRRADIKSKLQDFMPGYVGKTKEAAKLLIELSK